MPKKLTAPMRLPVRAGPTDEQLRAWNLAALRSEARSKLDSSDWKVVRASERGAALPRQWLAWRDVLRAMVEYDDDGGDLPGVPSEPAFDKGD